MAPWCEGRNPTGILPEGQSHMERVPRENQITKIIKYIIYILHWVDNQCKETYKQSSRSRGTHMITYNIRKCTQHGIDYQPNQSTIPRIAPPYMPYMSFKSTLLARATPTPNGEIFHELLTEFHAPFHTIWYVAIHHECTKVSMYYFAPFLA